MIKTSIPRCLSALLLFAAVALLQAQVAFADCLTSDNAVPDAAMAYCQLDSGFTGKAETDRVARSKLCARFCASPYAPKSRTNHHVAPHDTLAWPSDQPVVAYAPLQSAVSSQWFLNDPPVTRQLIYHLQRLLI